MNIQPKDHHYDSKDHDLEQRKVEEEKFRKLCAEFKDEYLKAAEEEKRQSLNASMFKIMFRVVIIIIALSAINK